MTGFLISEWLNCCSVETSRSSRDRKEYFTIIVKTSVERCCSSWLENRNFPLATGMFVFEEERRKGHPFSGGTSTLSNSCTSETENGGSFIFFFSLY